MASILYANLLEQKKAFVQEKSSALTGLLWDTNMATVSLFWDSNMAAVTSCENSLYQKRDKTQESVRICKECMLRGDKPCALRTHKPSHNCMERVVVALLHCF